MLKRAIICALLALSIPAQASAESWLCIADMSTGFSADKTTKIWRQANFRVSDKRVIIKPSDNPSWKYEVNEFGKQSDLPAAWCKDGPNDYGYLFCTSLFGEFKFNTINLRYLRTFLAGYVEITPSNTLIKEGENDPGIEIGRCSKI